VPLLKNTFYFKGDREFSRDSIARVEAAGCEAVCVTVDTPVLGFLPWQMRAAAGLMCISMSMFFGANSNHLINCANKTFPSPIFLVRANAELVPPLAMLRR
jgi:FMN-dependent dehydrogenase